MKRLAGERREIERAMARLHAEIRRAATAGPSTGTTSSQIADSNDQVRHAEQRRAEIDARLSELQHELVDETDVAAAFADFDNVWKALSPREQTRVLHLLLSRVEYDAADSAIEVAFHAAGITALAGDRDEAERGAENAA